MTAADRTRTVTWEDPSINARAAREMDGLEFIRAMAEERLPFAPIGRLMGFRISTVEKGRVVFEAEPGEHQYNPIGSVHGGMACAVFDSAMGCAINTMLPAGVRYTTLEIKVNFLRPITVETGSIFCEGRTIHVGRSTATAEATLTDGAGKLHGHATTTCMVFRDEKPNSEGEGAT